MVLQMVRPSRREGTSKLIYRARVPVHIKDEAQGRSVVVTFPASGGDEEHRVQVKVGKAGVKFTLNTRDPSVAKERAGLAGAYLSRFYAQLKERRGQAVPVGSEDATACVAASPLEEVRLVSTMTDTLAHVTHRLEEASSQGLTFSDLLAQWWASVQPMGISLNTYAAYKAAFNALARHVGHTDAHRVTKADMEAFRDARLATGRAHGTVTAQIDGIRGVYSWAVDKGKININPAKGITMPKHRKTVTHDRDFTEEEARAILKTASTHADPARRWIPWLCAYTGARAGEIAQLRTQDIRQDAQGGWIINITPEAGTVKTKHFREVPLHDHLIDQGFTRFVQKQRSCVVKGEPDGYLFLPVSLDADDEDKSKARDVVSERVRVMVKSDVGITGKQPNHAWRHTFKTIGREVGISEHTLDALCGHTPSTVGGSYGKVSLRVKREAIDRLPRWSL